MLNKMRKLGLDVGDKRIGIAVSDSLGLTAQGLSTIDREGCMETLKKIIKEYNVDSIVVGIPKMLNGRIGIQGEKVIRFVEELRAATNLPISLWDERLSTITAEKVLIQADLKRKKRKRLRDKLSATLILQNYLDSIKK
jgi:putative Holliday junction resolvase